jgi:hypothetical protein
MFLSEYDHRNVRLDETLNFVLPTALVAWEHAGIGPAAQRAWHRRWTRACLEGSAARAIRRADWTYRPLTRSDLFGLFWAGELALDDLPED